MYRFQNYNKSEKTKRTFNGEVFDSRQELNRYIELLECQKQGKIANLKKQVKFELQPAFVDFSGKKQRAINYIADFTYSYNGKEYVEDVKSRMTVKLPQYILKKKMFMFRYPQYCFVEFLG